MPVRKPAETSQPVHELIRDRWSPRSFADKPVEKDVLISLFEAARWAPSCNNSQPWRYIVATRDNAEEYERAQNCINERNQRWSRLAPVVGFVCAWKLFPNGNPSRTAWYDTGMASGQLLLQATARGLVAHQMAGILYDKVVETYAVPEDAEVVCGFALGYQGEPDALIEELAQREVAPRERKPLADMVFSGTFGSTSDLIKS